MHGRHFSEAVNFSSGSKLSKWVAKIIVLDEIYNLIVDNISILAHLGVQKDV